MNQKYRLLRDNKEQGPFSLEELLALSLRPLDLVWVVGRSAGWRYPSEVDSLKPYLGENNTPAPQPLPTPHPAAQQPRPASDLAASPAPYAEISAPADEGEPLTAEGLERKAEEIRRRVQAYAEQNGERQQGVQTKYARSLEDLKQEYADWLHDKKKKKRFAVPSPGRKTWIGTGVAGFVLLLAAGFVLRRPQPHSAQPLTASENIIRGTESSHEARQDLAVNHPDDLPLTDAVAEPPAPLPQSSSVDAFIDSVRRVLAGKSSYPLRHENGHAAVSRKDTPLRLQMPAETTAIATTVPPMKKEPAPPRVNMNARFEQDPNRHHVTSLEVTIQNNGEQLLRTVSVDVFFYRKGDRLFDKQTLYFNNVHPGNSITLSLPGNRKAFNARFQLGAIQE